MKTTKRYFITFVLISIFALLWVGAVAAAPIPSVTLGGAGDVFIGTSPINLSVTFDNTAAPSPANIGYGPFIDVYFPVNGADGAAGTSLPLDGISYLPGTASYLGISVTETILSFPAGPLGVAPCGPTETQVTHPYALDITHTPIVVCGTPGDQLVVFQLPFGSFTPDQPAATIDFQASLSNFADLNPINPDDYMIYARGGFEFGTDPLDNPCCDPTFFTDGSPSTITDNPVGAINPILMTLSKTDSPPEGEVATGPNHPHFYTVTVEIAPGQTVTNLDIFDYVDDNIVITGITAAGASSVTVGGVPPVFPLGPVVANGTANRVLVTYASASGTVSFTINYFVPLLDAAGNPIIAPNNGADSVTENRANAIGDWDPLDPRDAASTNNAIAGDATCPACPPNVSHVNEPLPVQKSVTNLTDSNPSPGDVLEYTFEIQVSDFFALDDVQIYDIISDGQRFVPNSLNIAYTQHGASFSNAVNPANLNVREYFTGGADFGTLPDLDAPTAVAGDTVLAIDLSAEILAELGLNQVLGGCVPTNGTQTLGIANPNCDPLTGGFNGGTTSITLTYQTTILDEFTDSHLEPGNSNDPSVDHGDTLDNVVSIEADTVLDTFDLDPTGSPSAVVNGSGAGVTIAQGLTEKTIYSIYDPLNNAFLPTAGVPEVSPGHIITFRLRYEMPSTDFEQFSLSDYLPLPVLDANEVTTFNDVVSNGTNTFGSGIPAAGQAMWGPTPIISNFRSRMATLGTTLQNGLTVPTITVPGGTIPAECGGGAIDPNENFVNFCFGDFDDPNNFDSFIDVLFSVTVSDDPFADELFLTNFVRGGTDSTNAGGSNSDEIVQFELRQPILLIRKGISDSTNPNEGFSETPNPALAPAGSAGTFTPPLESSQGIGNGEVDNGTNADATGLDAGDTVRYVITIQNTGGAAAFDIELFDTLPAGLTCNSATVNLNVTQGDGTPVTYFMQSTGAAPSPATVCDFFSNFDGNAIDGIILVDPTEGLCQSPIVDPALAVIVITYDLTIDGTVAAGDILTNTTTITNYSNSEGGPTHLSDPANYPQDSASIEIAGELLKEIVSTSEADSSDDVLLTGELGFERPVLIGEVVRYSLTFNVPEGESTNVVIVDNLPSGMQYVGNPTFSYNNWTGPEPADPAISGGVAVGDAVTFTYGTITNPDNDDDIESVTIEFDAIVSNIAANDDGVSLINNADLFVAGNLIVSSEDRIVEIIEPSLSMTKEQRDIYNGTIITTGDAGDQLVYTVSITNNGNAPAYDVQLTDFIPITYLTQFGPIIPTGVGDCCFTYNAGTGEWNFGWTQINPGQTVSATIQTTINNSVAPLDTWTNTADIVYNSLPDDDGSLDNVPGLPGTSNGLRNGDDGVGGATNDYAETATTPAFTVPELSLVKQVEHPINTPVADLFGGAYSDSTSDPNTGTSEYTASNVDIAIGETFSYIITFTLPEGTTYDFTNIDAASPINQNGGRENRVIQLLSAEVIWVGGNLTLGGGLGTLGQTFTITDSNGDGDGSSFQAWIGGGRDVLNTPDGVTNDDDRYIIRVTARLDDEDDAGGAADALAAPVQNIDGTIAQNKVQLQWRDSNGTQYTRNPPTLGFADIDIIEPFVDITKATIVGTDLESGDTATFDLVMTNTLNAPAYNVEVTDTLPNTGANAYLTFAGVDAANSTCDDLTGFAANTSGFDVIFTWDQLLVGQSCTIRFNATVTDFVTPNETYTNNVSVTSYDSLDVNTDPDNRNYTGGTANSTFTTADVAITKAYTDTSEDHTDPGDTRTAINNANEVPLVIGEIIRYEIRVQLIEGTHTNLVVEDLVPSGLGIIYDSQYTVTFPAGVTSTNPDLAGISGVGGTVALYNDAGTLLATNTDLGAGNAISLFFGAATINTDADSSTTEEIIIGFNALVLNSVAASNDRNDQLDNLASVSEGSGTSFAISNIVHARIHEPLLTITKDAAPIVGDAGDTITFTVTVTNDNNAQGATAFDVNIIDILPAEYTNLIVTNNGGGTNNSSGTTLSIYFPSLAQGASVTVEYTAQLVIGVAPAQVITNTADATWTSLPGNFGTADGSGGNNTGSDLGELNTNQGSHNSGDNDGERNGTTAPATPNDYETTDTADVTVVQVEPEKSIIASSESHTSDASFPNDGSSDVPVAIGEVVTFQLVLTIPEGTSNSVIMSDVLVQGIDYISGSTRVYTNSALNMTISGLGAVSNDPLFPDAVPEDIDGAPTNAGTVRYDAGTRTVEINLGNILNSDNDADAEQVVILFDVVVVNDAASSLGTIWTNEFDASVSGNPGVPSNQVSLIIQEPQATITKSINAAESTPATTGPFDGGDTVVYDIVVIGVDTTSFNLNIFDGVDANLDLQTVQVIIPVTNTYTSIESDVSNNGVPPEFVDVTLSELRPSDSVTIRVTATVRSTVTIGQIIANQASVTWTSLPDTGTSPNPTGSDTPGGTGASNGERSGQHDGLGGVNDYNNSSNVDFDIVGTVDTIKSIVATTESNTNDGSLPNFGDLNTPADPNVPVAIGEILTYRLVVEMPEGTSPDVQVIDTLSPNIEYVADSARVSHFANNDFTGTGIFGLNDLNPSTLIPAGAISFGVTGPRELTFDMGQVVNNDADNSLSTELLIIEFQVVVVDDIGTNTLGAIWANEFSVDLNSDGTDDDTSNQVTGEVIEPILDMSKSFSPDEQLMGGTVTMTLEVSNTGNAPIFDLEVTDILDDWLDVGDDTNVSVSFNAAATSFGSSFTNNSNITAGHDVGITDNINILISGLPAGGVATITVTMQIATEPFILPIDLPRTITNTADVIGDSLSEDDSAGPDTHDREYSDSASDDLNVVKPTLLVTKTDSIDPVAAGALMSYTVTIQNTGTPNFDATNVVFTDELPTGFIVTLVVPSQGTCSPIVGGILTCNLGTIASTASANVVITGRYPATTVVPAQGYNLSYVTSDEGNDGDDPVSNTNSDTPADDERAEETTDIINQVDVAITKVVDDASPNEGDLITFTLNITNNGPSQAFNVNVLDGLPAGLSFVRIVPTSLVSSGICTGGAIISCDFLSLNVGQTRTIGIEATVDAGTATVPETTITNTAIVSVNPDNDINPTNNSASADVVVDGMDLQVTKVVSNATPNEGESISYTITVTNLGPAPASGILVEDNLPAGVTYVSDNSATTSTDYDDGTGIWDLSSITLDAGDSLSLVINATVDVGASALLQPRPNTATIISTHPDTNTLNDTATANISVGGLDLSLVKGVNNATPNEGDTIVYSIIVENLGAANATDIEVIDVLPSSVNYGGVYSVNRPGTSFDGITWDIPSLLAGQSIRLDITVTVNAGTAGNPYTNTASIIDVDQNDVNPANNQDDATITVGSLDIGVVKTVDNATPAEGDTVVWSITVINNGPGTATDLVIDDVLPVAGVAYVSDNSASLLNSLGNPTTYVADEWTIGTLDSGESLTLQITTTVNIGATGTYTNIAEVDTLNHLDQPDTNAANDTDDAIIAISGLDLQVTKTVDNPTPNELENIVYSITVENFGPATATNVQITDDIVALGLPVTLGIVTAPNDSQGNPTTYINGVWSIPQLDAGQSLTLQLPAQVNAGTSGTAPFTNTAVLTAVDQADSNPLNNDDDATVTVGGVDIAVTKVVDNPAPNQGDNVTYTITVTNNGPATADDVNIIEDLPLDGVNLTYVSDLASQGDFNPTIPTAIWDIGTLTSGQTVTLSLTVTVEIANGQILNIASLDTASLDQADTNSSNNEDTATITLNGVDLSVVKTVNNPTPNTGDNVIYTIVATNNGPIPATNVTVLDILPAGVTYVTDNAATLFDDTPTQTSYDVGTGDWTIGTLNAGSSLSLTIEVTVNINGGQVTNTAEITGNEPESNSSNNIDDAVISVDSADLSLSKNISTTTPQIGDFITYTVTVSNAGPNIAYNVEVRDTLPSTVTYVSSNVSQGTVDTTTPGLPVLVWDVGTIPVNGAATLQITARVDNSFGTFVNVAEVTASDQADPDSTPDNGVTTEDDYDVSSFLFDPPFGRKVFDASGLPQLEWTVIWVNPNTDPLGVSVTDPVVAGTTFVTGSLTCSSPGTLVVTTCAYDALTNSIVFSGTIFPDPGITPATIGSAVNPLIINYRVTVDNAVTEVRNEAFLNSVNGDNVSVSNTWTRDAVTAPVVGGGSAAITLTKYVEPAIAFPGEALTWILEVSNPSGADATGVILNDKIPTGLNIQTTQADAGTVTVTGQDVTWNIGTVAAGQTLRLRITTQVSPDLTEAVTNTAIVFGNNFQAQEASATAAFVSGLPNTGETAWWANWLVWFALLIIPTGIGAGWWMLRRMRQNH